MSTWEQFEIDCTRFLMEQFGEYATFMMHLTENMQN